MKNYYKGILPGFHLWTDILLLNVSYFAASRPLLFRLQDFDQYKLFNLLLVSNLIWIVCINLVRPYSFTRLSYNSYRHIGKLILSVVAHFGILEAYLFTLDFAATNEHLIFITFEIFICLSVFTHLAAILTLQYLRKAGFNSKRYAIIGDDSLSRIVEEFYDGREGLGYQFCGTFSIGTTRFSLDLLESFMDGKSLDYLYCSLSGMSNAQIQGVLKLAERKKTQIRLIPDFLGHTGNNIHLENHSRYPVINVETKPMSSFDERILKRSFDLVFSAVVMLAGLPLFLVVMLLVRLSSKGPVFFLQERTGRWGKPFRIIKFRTMYADAERFNLKHSLGAVDPRITPIGHMLRRTRLDELPQFINVLKGDMSVVGPRPLHKFDVEMLMNEASHDFQKILTIRPGITSIGQIRVGYATTAKENVDRLRHDMLYLSSYSLVRDISLILLTIQVIMLGKGR